MCFRVLIRGTRADETFFRHDGNLAILHDRIVGMTSAQFSPLSAFAMVPPPLALSIPAIDAGVILFYLAATIALGIWVGRGQKSLNDYLLGDRNLPWWAVLGSIVATETSTATVLSVPGFAFAANGDMRFLQLAMGYILGRILVAWILLPQYFRGELFTSYEVLSIRFGESTKSLASLLFLAARTLGDGLRLYLAALALATFAGIDLSLAVIIVGVSTIVYTVFGGMRSVVWNDCVQMVVYLAGGMLIIGLVAARLPSGWESLIDFGRETGRFRLLDFTFDISSPAGFAATFSNPYTFWAGLIGGLFLTLGTHGTDQLTVQRLLSSRNQSDARKALITSGIVVFGQFVLFLFLGVALAAYYHTFPSVTPIEKPDDAVARFIAHDMPVGLRGVLLAAVFAAAMSTMSSSLNSSSASTMNDLLKPLLGKLSAGRQLLWGRSLTILFGVAQIGVGLAAQPLINALGQSEGKNVIDAVLAIASFTTGIILGVFFLGVFTRRVGQIGALAGMLFGAIVTVTLFSLGNAQKFDLIGLPSDFRLAWPWYAFVGSLATFLMGVVVGWPLGSKGGEEGDVKASR